MGGYIPSFSDLTFLFEHGGFYSLLLPLLSAQMRRMEELLVLIHGDESPLARPPASQYLIPQRATGTTRLTRNRRL